MRKLIILMFAISTFVVNAQFYAQFNIGYSVPIQTDKRNIFSKNNTLTPPRMYNQHILHDKINDTTIYRTEDIRFEMIKGIFIDVEGGYILKNKIRFSLNFSYFDNHTLTSFNKNNTKEVVEESNDSTNNWGEQYSYKKYVYNYTCQSLTVNPNIAYIVNYKKFSSEFFIGFTTTYLWFYKNTYLNSFSENKYSSGKSYITIKDKYKPIKIFNINYGIQFLYKLTKSLNLSFNAKFHFAQNGFYLPNKKTRYYYSIESSWGQNEISEEEKEMDSYDSQFYFYKTIDLSLGIRYTFGKANKSETTK